MRRAAFGFLSLLSFLESAQAGGGLSGFGYAFLLFGVINLAFYGLAALFLISAIFAWWRKKQKVAIVLIGLALLPFLHYSSVVLRSQFEPERRRQQLARLMQKRVVPAIPPRSMEAIHLVSYRWRELKVLVAAGVVDEVLQPYGGVGKTLVYERQEGPECIQFEASSGAGAELSLAALARQAFRRCAKETRRDGAASAPIQLFAGDRAPNRYAGPACLGGGNYPLELRMAPDHGGALVAFWESPGYVAYAFPPALPGENIWWCEQVASNSPDYHTPDIFGFVSTALGFKEADDFPRTSEPQFVFETLQLLEADLGRAQYAHIHVLALLGQWPSTPAIDEALDDPRVVEHGANLIRKATALLTDPGNEERRKRFYPHLATHMPSLLRICSKRGRRFDTEESCSRLVGAARGTATTPQR